MALKQMESVKESIGGNTFYIKPFPALKAANLTGELASVLSPILGAFAPLVGDSDLLDVDANVAAEALSNIPSISGDKIESLVKKLLLGGNIVVEYETEDGESQQETLDKDLADEIFCGDVQDLFMLCFYVIRINFNGFFKRLTTLSGKAEQVVAKKQRKRL